MHHVVPAQPMVLSQIHGLLRQRRRVGHDAVPSAPVPAQGLAGQGGVGGCDLTRALLGAAC
jgi:hypothetical protein